MKNLCLSLFGLFIPLLLVAQEQPDCFCCTEYHDDFDFWVGDWNVYNGDNLVGTNRVVKLDNACAIQENWEGTQGSKGSSYNFYDTSMELWRQVWIDSRGGVLDLFGMRKGNQMILTSEKNPIAETVSEVIQMITWTLNDDGSVRQHWQVSRDRGETWSTAFDGLYIRKTEDK